MKTFGILLIGWLAVLGTAEARLGENKEELENRFGKAVNREGIQDGDCRLFIFKVEQYEIGCFLRGGKTITIVYRKGGEKMTDNEIYTLLKKNSSGSGFEMVNKTGLPVVFHEQSTKRNASYDGNLHALYIYETGELERFLGKQKTALEAF